MISVKKPLTQLRHTKNSDYMYTNSLIDIISLINTVFVRFISEDSIRKQYSTDQFNLKDSKFIKVDSGVGDSLHHKISVLFRFMIVFWPVHFTLHLQNNKAFR